MEPIENKKREEGVTLLVTFNLITILLTEYKFPAKITSSTYTSKAVKLDYVWSVKSE